MLEFLCGAGEYPLEQGADQYQGRHQLDDDDGGDKGEERGLQMVDAPGGTADEGGHDGSGCDHHQDHGIEIFVFHGSLLENDGSVANQQ